MRVAHFVCTATGLQISHKWMIVFIILRLRLCSLCRSVDKTKTCHRCIRSRFRVRKPKNKKGSDFSKPFDFERKTRVGPSALYSVYQAITFAQYYTPNSRDTWEGSGCRFRVRLLPYKLQNYSCLRQIYE